MKRPFHITFQGDRTIIFDEAVMPRVGGTVMFGTNFRRDYIKNHHPEMIDKFDKGVKDFYARMDRIDDLLK